MRVVMACDSFKGSLSARDVGEAIGLGLRDGWHGSGPLELVNLPMADGGEGTIDAVVDALGGERRTARVSGPLGESVEALWGYVARAADEPALAIIEMATAAGLPLLADSERDPRRAGTRGVGELTREALDAGCRRFLFALGGSATNDGGAGFAQALGASLRDGTGAELPPGGAALAQLVTIDRAHLDARLGNCVVEVACDVDNPLAGSDGASAVFGPQKGADEPTVAELDAALSHYGALLDGTVGRPVSCTPGAGAAGGLASALMGFAGGVLRPGAELIADMVRLDDALSGADLVITGEGRIDAQSLRGKLPVTVARRAAARGIPVVVIAGSLGRGAVGAYDAGVTAMLSIVDQPMTLAQAQDDTPRLLRQAGEAVARLWQAAARAPVKAGAG